MTRKTNKAMIAALFNCEALSCLVRDFLPYEDEETIDSVPITVDSSLVGGAADGSLLVVDVFKVNGDIKLSSLDRGICSGDSVSGKSSRDNMSLLESNGFDAGIFGTVSLPLLKSALVTSAMVTLCLGIGVLTLVAVWINKLDADCISVPDFDCGADFSICFFFSV